MLYGTGDDHSGVLFHIYTPTTEVNGLQQVGKVVPIKPTSKIDPKLPGLKSRYGTKVSSAGIARVSSTTKEKSWRVLAANGPGSATDKNIGMGSGWRGWKDAITATKNPSTINYEKEMFGVVDLSPGTGLNVFAGGSGLEGRKYIGMGKGTSGVGRRVHSRIPAKMFSTGLSGLADLIPDNSAVDWRGLTESGFPGSTPLNQAGTYHEGQVMDILDRLNIIREGWQKGMITDADYKQFAFPLADRAAEITKVIAGQGSKPASVVNTIWGEIQNQGYIKGVNMVWVPQFPPAWPPRPVQIVFPKPNRKGLFKQITSNPIKAAVTIEARLVTGGITAITNTGIVGAEAKKIGNKVDTVVAGAVAGGAVGFVASGLNPVGAVAGGAAGGAKGLVEATKTSGSGNIVKSATQGAVIGGITGATVGVTSLVHSALAKTAIGTGAAVIPGVMSHPTVPGAAQPPGVTSSATGESDSGGVINPSPEFSMAQGQVPGVDTSSADAAASGDLIVAPISIGAQPPGTPGGVATGGVLNTAKQAASDTIQGGVKELTSDPLGFIKRKATQIKNVTSRVKSAQAAFGPDGNPSAAVSGSPISSPTLASAWPVALLALGVGGFFFMRKR